MKRGKNTILKLFCTNPKIKIDWILLLYCMILNYVFEISRNKVLILKEASMKANQYDCVNEILLKNNSNFISVMVKGEFPTHQPLSV